MTILLAEQSAAMALGVADRAYVLERSPISLPGAVAALQQTEQARRLYLGT